MDLSIKNENKLPPNFNKYINIINYYKNNGIDCLQTIVEQFRFYIIYIYSKQKISLHPKFHKELKAVTNLVNRKNFRWGCWSNPGTDSYDIYNINDYTFYMPGFKHGKITKKFLYNELSKVSDIDIEYYFNELHAYGKLSIIKKQIEYITITNQFNESKIIVNKEMFYKYVGYQTILEDYTDENINKFSIDVLFNDKVADGISALLNDPIVNEVTLNHYNAEELEQKFNVIDFLQINLNYDHIK